MCSEWSEDRAIWTMHVVTPIGIAIGFWKPKLWEIDGASTETDTPCGSLVEKLFICEFVSIENDLCGAVGSPAGSMTASWYSQSTKCLGNSSNVPTYDIDTSLY